MSFVSPDVEHDDGAAHQGGERPAVKRKLSRLNHMTVSKAAAEQGGESVHQGLDTAISRRSPAKVDQISSIRCMELEDGSDDAAANQDNGAGTFASLIDWQQQRRLRANEEQSPAPAQCTSISNEVPSVTGAAATSLPDGRCLASSGSADANKTATTKAKQPFRVNLDDEDDDDWEDQPAAMNVEAADEATIAMGSGEPLAGQATEDSMGVAAYDPTHRRRTLYDDEDEWEDFVLGEKQRGKQAVSDVELRQEEQGDKEDLNSPSSGDTGPAGSEDILADDPDATLASTQRLLRETAARDALGKGFKPEVAPVNNLLARLAARQAALEAKAKQRVAATEAPVSEQAAFTLEQLKAHLQNHSIGGKLQHQPVVEAHAAGPVAFADQEEHAATVMADTSDGNEYDADMDDDIELELVPAQQQETSVAAGMLPPDTQQLANDLPPLPPCQADITVVLAERTFPGSAPELELQLDDNVRDSDEQHLCIGKATANAAVANSPDTHGQESEHAVSGSEAHGEGTLESSVIDSSASEESNSYKQSDSLVEPEPLHWEEEEEVAAGNNSSKQQQDAVDFAEEGGDADDEPTKQKSKVFSTVCQYRAAGGFIEAEADLSDDAQGEGESDDEDLEDDGMLAELIAEVKEGKLDESRRADLHAKWLAGKDEKEMNELLEALKRGFKRKRKAGAGLDDDEDDGNDAAARRRRAQLLGTLDEEEEDQDEAAGTDRLKRLDFVWKEEESDLQAATAALAAEIEKRDMQIRITELQQASEAQDGKDAVQLLQMELIDEDSQHIAALLSKSASAQLGGSSSDPGLSLASQSAAGHSRAPSSKLKHQTGPYKESSVAAPTLPAATGGFTFQMFGKDLTNSSRQQGAKQHQVAGSFIGRQVSNSATVRAACNYGASRSFVFGSDPSNLSNSGVNKGEQSNSKTVVGPSSFAGLSKLIADAANKGLGPSRLGQSQTGADGQNSALLQMLGNKKGSGSGSDLGNSKLHMDAVRARFKAVDDSRGVGNSNAATSREAWQF